MNLDLTLILNTFIANLPATLTALGTLLVGLHNIRKTGVAIEGVKKIEEATNGMKDALVAAAKKEGHAAGVVDEKVRKDARDALVKGAVLEGRAAATAEAARDQEIREAAVGAATPSLLKEK